jgi:hypothetical protein
MAYREAIQHPRARCETLAHLLEAPAYPGLSLSLCGSASTNRRQKPALMRINVWIVVIVLIALFAVTRLLRYQQDTQRICADDPSASVCQR